MHFLLPSFALFTVLMGIPLVIHLYGRSRARVRRFPALDFLLSGHRKVARRTQLRQLLLLLLRAAVMAAVPLCLAKPFFETLSDLPAQVGGAQSAVIVIDDSLASSYRMDRETLLQRAQAHAQKLLSALPRDADTALVLGSRGAAAPVPELTYDRGRVQRAIAALKPSYRAADLQAALKRGAQILSGGHGARRVYLIANLSAHALDSGVVAPPDVEVVPVDVVDSQVSAQGPLPNRAIVDLHVEPAPGLGRSGVRITAEVANFGDLPVKDLPVTLLMDGKAVARGLLDLTARGRGQKRFFHVLEHAQRQAEPAPAGTARAPEKEGSGQERGEEPGTGLHDITVELLGDSLPADDRRYLRVEVQRTLRVLVIDGDPRTARRDDEVFYLETALRPGDRDDSQLLLTTTTAEELSRRSLSEFDTIFLCNVKAQDLQRGQMDRALRDYVTGGGGLFITVGDNTDPDAYNATLLEILPQPLASAKTAGPVRYPGDEPEARESALLGAGERLGRLDRRHPLLLPFVSGHAAEGLHEARFGRYLLLRPTPKSTGAEGGAGAVSVLASFDTGAPALLERQVGSGRVLLFTSSIDRDWNDLPIQPAFLPLMQQAVRYLSRAPLKEPEPPALIGQRHEIKLRDGDTRVEVTLPSGQKRLFEHERVALRHRLGFLDTEEPGPYRVAIASDERVLRPRPAESFVVNVDPAESDLRRAPPGRVEALARPLGTSDGSPGSTPHRRVELWHALGALLILLLVGEALLLREK